MATLYGVDVTVTFEITGWFETNLSPQRVTVTIGADNELVADIEARVISDWDGSGQPSPVPGPTGLLTGQVILDIRENEVFASFTGQAQPAGFKIKIEGLTPDGVAPGTIQDRGWMTGVNMANAPTYDAATSTLTLDWFFLGFQPGTVVDQTVFYDNQLHNAPVAVDDALDASSNAIKTGLNVLSNDSDLDNAGSIGIVDLTRVGAVEGNPASVGQWVDLGPRGRILINADGSLSFDPAGQFDDLPADQTRTVDVQYTATDSTGLSSLPATVAITVTGVNHAPTALALSNNIVNHSEGLFATVGALTTTDPDAGDTHTYSFVAGNGSTDNGKFSIQGNELSLAVPSAIPDGRYSVRVKATDASGASTEQIFEITVNDDVPPATPVILNVAGRGDGGITNDSTPTVSGTAEAGSTVTVWLGGSELGTTMADGAGNWSYTPSVAIAEGSHSFTSSATDSGGNNSARSASVGVTIDTTPPSATIFMPEEVLAVEQTATVTVTFSEAVSGVGITDFAVPHGAISAPSSTDGGIVWTMTYTPPASTFVPATVIFLAMGGVQDAAGNFGAGTTQSNSFRVDTEVPVVNSVDVPVDGTYGIGDALEFVVNLSETVLVDASAGTPRLELTLDTGGVIYAGYVSGSGSDKLTFRADLTAGLQDTNGITLDGVIDANGAEIKDGAGNVLVLDLNLIPSTTGILIDAVLPVGGGTDPDPDPVGSDGDDEISPPPVDGTFDGGDGRDTVEYTGQRGDFTVVRQTDGTVVVTGPGYTHTLLSIERIEFADGTLVLDIDTPFSDAIYRLYGGAFGRAPDEAGLDFWVDSIDLESALLRAAQHFLESPEFAATYGPDVTDEDLVALLYQNILGRAGEPDGIAFWNAFLENGGERAKVLYFFTQLPEYVGISEADIANGYWVT